MVKLFRMYSNLCDHNPPTLQTDRQTTCDRNTALCTKVHRAVKTIPIDQGHTQYSKQYTHTQTKEENNKNIRSTVYREVALEARERTLLYFTLNDISRDSRDVCW